MHGNMNVKNRTHVCLFKKSVTMHGNMNVKNRTHVCYYCVSMFRYVALANIIISDRSSFT